MTHSAGAERRASTLTDVLDLRPARLDDPEALAMIDEVQRYYVELYGGPDDNPLDPSDFVPPRGRFLIGSDNGSDDALANGPANGVSVAMGGWSRVSGAPLDAEVRRMYVRESARRRGYAATLLDALEADARTAGAARVVLSTGLPQDAAVRFYRARGYLDIEPFGFYAGTPGSVHLGKVL